MVEWSATPYRSHHRVGQNRYTVFSMTPYSLWPYVGALVLAAVVGGACLTLFWRVGLRQGTAWHFIVPGVLIVIAGVAFTFDRVGERAVAPLREEPVRWRERPELVDAARRACWSLRHCAEARALVRQHLLTAWCGDDPKLWRWALPELARLPGDEQFANYDARRGTAWTLGRQEWCRLYAPWSVPFFFGGFSEAADKFEWDHPRRLLWLLVAAGRFREGAELVRQTRNDGKWHGTFGGPQRQADTCWMHYLDARAGSETALEYLLRQIEDLRKATAALPEHASPPYRTSLADCEILAADLTEGTARLELLPPRPQRHTLRWLLRAEVATPTDRARLPWSLSSSIVARGNLLAEPVTALHVAALERVSESTESTALLIRGDLLKHAAAWASVTGRPNEALKLWRRGEDAHRAAATQTPAAAVTEDAGLVVLYLQAGRIDKALALVRSREFAGGERLRAMVEYSRNPDPLQLAAWTKDDMDEGACPEWSQAQEHPMFPCVCGLLGWHRCAGLADAEAAREHARYLVERELTRPGDFVHGNCTSVHQLWQQLHLLGVADDYPRVGAANQRHVELWLKRDRVVPLLLLGIWWNVHCPRD